MRMPQLSVTSSPLLQPLIQLWAKHIEACPRVGHMIKGRKLLQEQALVVLQVRAALKIEILLRKRVPLVVQVFINELAVTLVKEELARRHTPRTKRLQLFRRVEFAPQAS